MEECSMEEIRFVKTQNPKAKPKDNELGFGKYYTDHMFVMDYAEGKGWYDPRIVPYGPFEVEPATMVFHYGQTVFEGVKAYLNQHGEPVSFRPSANIKRLNRSAERLCIPKLDEGLVWRGLKKLLEIEKDWIPKTEGTSLYIRPLIIATDVSLGVRPSHTYKFFIILSPVGAYYAEGILSESMSPTSMSVPPRAVSVSPKRPAIMPSAFMRRRKPRKGAIPRYCGWTPRSTNMWKKSAP
jgi:branched-chain amino acid aminotransferase